LNTIDTHLSELKNDANSYYYESYEKWFGYIEAQPFPKWLLWLIIFGGGLLVLFIFFSITLRTQVHAKTKELVERHRLLELEIAERKIAEDKVKASLEEKEVLLKEIHHRVKNNLQVISSLLRLQSKKIRDSYDLQLFDESQDRIRTMALVHEKLYQSKDLAHIDFKDYLQKLVHDLLRAYRTADFTPDVKIHCDDIPMSIDKAIPCGLLINELITNVLKHAFPSSFKKNGLVEINVKSSNANHIDISVKDNGVGIKDDVDFETMDSLGIRLIHILAEDQLGGNIAVESKDGTEVRIDFDIE
jgi:two-component sensor histidine kinase